MQNISEDLKNKKMVQQTNILMPTNLDTSNTKYSWREVIAAWGFSALVEKATDNPDEQVSIALSMPKGWRTGLLGFSTVCLLFDDKKRVRAKFDFADLKKPLRVVPAISTCVDYDTHIFGDFGTPPRGFIGIVRFGGKMVFRTELMPHRIAKENTVAHLQTLCAKFIELHYPNTDAMAYWD